jgi:hypothetical protein
MARVEGLTMLELHGMISSVVGDAKLMQQRGFLFAAQSYTYCDTRSHSDYDLVARLASPTRRRSLWDFVFSLKGDAR